MKKKAFLAIITAILLLAGSILTKGKREITFDVSNLDGGKLILRKYKWGYPVRVDFRLRKGKYTLIAVKAKIPHLKEEFGYPFITSLNESTTVYLLLFPPSMLRKDLFRSKDSFPLYLTLYLRKETKGKIVYLRLMKKLTVYRR